MFMINLSTCNSFQITCYSCFKTRCQDMYMQQCFSDMNSGSRCKLYRHVKEDFQLEPYLRKNYIRDLRQCLTKIRLSSHNLYIERGRWQKAKNKS